MSYSSSHIADLLSFVKDSVDPGTLSRTDILAKFTGKHNLFDLTAFLKSVGEDTVIARAPVLYNAGALAEHLTTALALAEKAEDEIAVLDEIAAAVKLAEPEVPEYHAADGRADPSKVTNIKTRSYRQLEELIHPDHPINIYISGETGLGKSTAVFGIADKFAKPVIRVNMSGATDLDDLVGGIRIVDGNTIFDPGPVAIAMELGAILLLDECDAGRPQVLIDLHPVLELKGVLAKKARKMIYPAKGFQVIATGNSKGVGDETGKYIGVNTMNHAFLQRFAASVEFIPPTMQEMRAIMDAKLPQLLPVIATNLCKWYAHVLDSHNAGSVVEYINPRKMLDIGTLCLIFGATTALDQKTINAITAGLQLYETSLTAALVHLYDTIADDNIISSGDLAGSQAPGSYTLPTQDELNNRVPF